ncbi:putative vacuolar membrane protein [Pseudocercospora fuligena]|uniref:Putative vacuolar membrane protein n=1 Tax=Pseudocercospora fuligena TaxID=685502 RepID=A0A8H6RLD2_9PEZI|nr:putative vacuolar membrane protein [Pseudocercospora fuligena]
MPLESAVPHTIAERLDAPGVRRPSDSMAGHEDSRAWNIFMLPHAVKQWRRIVGLLLLGLTIFMWTATNFLSSSIFADDTYSKPYFVTYINTSFFIIPLIPILVNKAYKNPEGLRRWKDELRTSVKTWRKYTPLKQDEAGGISYHDSPVIAGAQAPSTSLAAHGLLDEPEMEHSQVLSAKDLLRSTSQEAPLTLPEIAKLSLEFCMLWFLANYFVAACLQYTTVASSTILTSTSSVFTLIFGAIFKVEKFTIRKLLGVLSSLAGIAIISSLDLSGNSSDDKHRGDFPEKSLREIAIGDCLAFLSAVMYGLYAVFMKKRISDETRVDMPVFFGFVGLINVLILWPGLFIFHWLGIETLEAPPTWRVTLIILCNSLGSLIGDIAWAYAVLLTSPIVVTVGLSITIPCSLIGQIVLNNQTAGIWYWLGACIVVLSFLFVNHEEKKDEEENGRESMPLSVDDVSNAAPHVS